MRMAIVALGCGLALQSTAAAPTPRAGAAAVDAAFDGSWSATGRRQTLPTETGRAAAITSLSGAIVLKNADGGAAGFQAEAIGFDDGATSSGRAVWTDSRGDRVFSTLSGEALQQGRRVTGTITGGTGRFAGVTGEYALTWQYAVADESDVVHGRSNDLRGRIRRPEGLP
jgi:hypothetical protein